MLQKEQLDHEGDQFVDEDKEVERILHTAQYFLKVMKKIERTTQSIKETQGREVNVKNEEREGKENKSH